MSWRRALGAMASVLALAGGGVYAQLNEADLLLPEQAFPVSVSAAGDTVRLQWDIAEGYYLYKSKFKFRADDPDVMLGAPVLPAGEVKDDEFFGRIETYRGQVSVQLPVESRGAQSFMLEATSQGCADAGICYPPHTQTLRVALDGRTDPADALSAVRELGRSLGGVDQGEDEFLMPDEAFRFTAEPGEDGAVIARWAIADGYYLYRDKFKFEAVGDANVRLASASLPPGEIKDDPLFGRVEVYLRDVEARVPVQQRPADGRLSLEVGYQGCAEAGLCYPPITKTVDLLIPAAAAASTTTVSQSAPEPDVPEPDVMVSEQDRLASMLAGENRWLTVLSFFGVGLLLAFTPCVFPMIPILSGIIVGQGSQITTRKAFVLSVVYVLAMSVTYTVAGVVAGMFGENLQAALQNPWVLTSFAVVFVALAMSMFGFYDLQLPASWQSRLTELSNRQQGGTLVGVGIMGFLSALIVGPCVAPPLAGALIYIGQTGDAFLGGIALFALSLGMGAPLVAIGTLEGRFLPKAGGWMNAVKAVFGVLLLGVAIYLVDRVIPAWVSLLLWAALFIVSAIYLGALEPLGRDAGGFRKLWKGLGAVMMVYGVLLMIGAAAGGGDLMHPLKGIAVASSAEGVGEQSLPFRPVKGTEGLEAALASAKGEPVMLDFYADWCVTCIEMERFTFSDPQVQAALSNVVLLKADVTANDTQDKALMKQLGIIGPPAVLFFDAEGQERRGYRLVGFLAADEFRDHAERALN